MKKLLVWYLNLKNTKAGISLRYSIRKINDDEYICVDVSMIENIIVCNSIIASTTQQRVFGFFKIPIIILDELYYEIFTTEEKKFIIYHELGHARLGHFKRKFDDTYDEKLLIEHEADMYGIEHTSWETGYQTLQKINEVSKTVFGDQETNIGDRLDLLIHEVSNYNN